MHGPELAQDTLECVVGSRATSEIGSRPAFPHPLFDKRSSLGELHHAQLADHLLYLLHATKISAPA